MVDFSEETYMVEASGNEGETCILAATLGDIIKSLETHAGDGNKIEPDQVAIYVEQLRQVEKMIAVHEKMNLVISKAYHKASDEYFRLMQTIGGVQ
jgi:hypothetical protein